MHNTQTQCLQTCIHLTILKVQLIYAHTDQCCSCSKIDGNGEKIPLCQRLTMQFSSNLVEKHNAKFLVAFASQGSDIWSIIVRHYYSNQYNYAKPFKLDYQLDIESTQIIKYVSICNDKLAHRLSRAVM